jgi:hypothetical protein
LPAHRTGRRPDMPLVTIDLIEDVFAREQKQALVERSPRP